MRCSFRGVVLWKMATVKSVEDMLSSDVDESAVNALVGSLESQLASSTIQPPSQDINSTSVTVNHVNSSSAVDGAVVRLLDGQKHGGSSGGQPASLPSNGKPSPTVSQNADTQSASTTASSVLVTLPGALPASGYITQVTGQPQQTYFAPIVSNTAITPAKTLAASNQDIKIVYTTQPQVTVTNSTVLCNNLKPAAISNGSVAPVSMIAIRPAQPIAVAATLNSTVASTTSSMSAIHDLANIASQQAPIVIPSVCNVADGTTQTVTTTDQPPTQSKANGKPTTRMQLRSGDKIAEKNSNKIAATSSSTKSMDSVSISCSAPTTQPNVVATAVAKSLPQSAHHVNVVSQVVTNPSLLPSGVQIINVNPRLGAPGLAGTKTLAPRVLISNPLRIATSPQIITTRPGVAGQMHVAARGPVSSPKFIPLPGNKNTITLPPSMVRGAIIVKTENGPLQVVNIAGASGTPLPGGTTYRLQSIQPNAQGVRTVSPQQMTVTVPVSAGAVKVSQAPVPATQTIVGTVLHPGPSANAARIQCPTVITQTQQPQAVAVKVGVNGNVTTPLTVQTTTANNQAPSTPSQMSPNTAKKKCKNFLSTLIRLADEQPASVAKSVRNLIQGIIDGTIQAEEFTAKLQKELNSAPQPYLVPFLKKNLPFLRHSLITKELAIEGVRPPPASALSLPHPSLTNSQQTQVNQKKPPQPATQVRLMTTATTAPSNLTAQLLQTNQGMLGQRFVGPRPPVVQVTQSKNLVVTSQVNKVSTIGSSAAASSPATVGALQAKSPLLKGSPIVPLKDKAKSTYSGLRDDDDINDVAAMGGVNLVEESQKILASNSELVGTQIRSCKDESFFTTNVLQRRLHAIAVKHGLDEVSPDVTALVAHAAEERLKTLLEKLAVIAEHRVENPKCDPRYEVTQDVKSQIKFLEELDRLERRRHEEQEREMLMRAAKSRSKLEDPEQLKLKQKAKEMQRAEQEELRQRDANTTALLAIGPRKKMKFDPAVPSATQLGYSGALSSSVGAPKSLPRPRVKRVNFRDLLYLMEQERETIRTPLLYKSYLK